jgi:hypothetical protein
MDPLVLFGLRRVPCESRFHITLLYIHPAVQRAWGICVFTFGWGLLANVGPGESNSIHGSDLELAEEI